ncbi:MAG TPA: GNAT family protein [Solirubrobacteraceae bacterium]|jgi:RimJ/RimL family protein N-acetyltransferase|nr:GNAT family protein [Solirubrobacteraceae bacterium]
MRGALVGLEPLAPEHEDELFEVAGPAEIWDWWPFNPAVDRATFHAWMDDVLAADAAGAEVRFATRELASGRLVGSTSYCTLRPEHRGLEIGWTWLTPAAWGRGLNAEAKLLQLGRAFDVLGVQRVEFETDAENRRSRAALEALPAEFEGVMRDWKLVGGTRRRSSAIYSVLDGEWPAVQANLKRRVAARLG